MVSNPTLKEAARAHLDTVKSLGLRTAYWLFTFSSGDLVIDVDEFNAFIDALPQPEFLDSYRTIRQDERNDLVADLAQLTGETREQQEALIARLNREVELLGVLHRQHQPVFDLLGESVAKDLFRAMRMVKRPKSDAFRTATTALKHSSDDGLINWTLVTVQNRRNHAANTNLERHYRRTTVDPSTRKPTDVYTAEFEFDESAQTGEELVIRLLPAGQDDEVAKKACEALPGLYRQKLIAKGQEHFVTCIDKLKEHLAEVKYRRNGVLYLAPGNFEPLVNFIETFTAIVSVKFSPAGEEYEFLANPLLDVEQNRARIEKADAKVRGHIAKSLAEATAKLEDLRQRRDAWEEWAAEVVKADGDTSQVPVPVYEDDTPVPEVTDAELRAVSTEIDKLRYRAQQYAVYSSDELKEILTAMDTLESKRKQMDEVGD